MTRLLVATRKSNYTFTEGIFSWLEKGVKLSTLVHLCMAGYSPKDSPRPVLQQFLTCVQTRLEKTIDAS